MHIFTFAEIQSATNNFDEQLVLGEGAFGKVYKGLFAEKRVTDGDDEEITAVAIKRLNSKSWQGYDEFQTEITMLSQFRHCHIISLLGYCDRPLSNSNSHEMVLVYEFIPGGTLADRLYKKNGEHGKPPLSWVQRLNICIDAAHGLNYLHTGGSDIVRSKDTANLPKVIHGDMKSSNILLDYNLAAKVSDFGFSKLTPVGKSYYLMKNVKGTLGYMDPGYRLTKRLTRKSDVYSFGVVLLEVLCGRAAVDLQLPQEQHRLTKWAKRFSEAKSKQDLYQIIDPSIFNEIKWSSLQMFLNLVSQCLNDNPEDRPSMLVVVDRLEHVLRLQERPDKDSFAAGGSGGGGGGINYSILDEEILVAGGGYNVQVSSSIKGKEVIGSSVIEENFSVGGNYNKQDTLDSSIVNVGKGGNNQYENIVNDFRTLSFLPQYLGQQIQCPLEGENDDDANMENWDNDTCESPMIEALSEVMSTLEDVLQIPMDKEMFGEENETCFILKDSLADFSAMKPLDVTYVTAHLRHLYNKFESSRQPFRFFNPASFSATSLQDMSQLIQGRLKNAKRNQICYIPYNLQTKSHWVLIVIDLSNMVVYWLDSKRGRPTEKFKSVFNTGINSSHIEGRRMPTITWVTPTCPRQKRNTECGYYMMKFMKELLEDSSHTIDAKVTKLTEKDTYSMEELNEVRFELIEFIVQCNVQVSGSIKGKKVIGSDYNKGETGIWEEEEEEEEEEDSFEIEHNFCVSHEGGNFNFVSKWGNKQYENIVDFRTSSSRPQHLGQQNQWPDTDEDE